MSSPCERLSHKQRKITPIPFALYLIAGVWRRFGVSRIAILWTEPRSKYYKLSAWVDLWGPWKDATTYHGPFPIIAHPPCGPWGKLAWRSKESKHHGIMAMDFVHQYGGVVEQPLGSSLFMQYGRAGCEIEKVNQSDYGHPAPKPTILYWSHPEPPRTPSPFPPSRTDIAAPDKGE